MLRTSRDETGKLLQFRGPDSSPDCARCPCAKNGRPSVPVRAFGATGGLVLVGEGPGNEECISRYPFVGPSGKLIDKALKAAGIDRALLWVTNALLCPRPRDDSALGKAVDCCRPRLREELAAADPTAVLAFGGTAMRALELPVQGVSDARGTLQQTPLVPGVPVFSTMHPAALLRGGAGDAPGAGGVSGGTNKQNVDAQMLFFQADIEKAWRVAIGDIAPAWSDDIDVFVPDSAPAAPQDASAPVAQKPVFDAIAYMVAHEFPQAFIDYYAAHPHVWELFISTACKGVEINASSEMVWGVVGFALAKEKQQLPLDAKPYFFRLFSAWQAARNAGAA